MTDVHRLIELPAFDPHAAKLFEQGPVPMRRQEPTPSHPLVEAVVLAFGTAALIVGTLERARNRVLSDGARLLADLVHGVRR